MKKILMSCYACEPNKGSEPGVGWNWAIQMSQDFEVTVYTRSNNREAIESFLSQYSYPNLKFKYYDLPSVFIKLKKQGILNTTLYYLFWQFAISRNKRHEVDKFDIVHHVTFNMFLCPGIWRPKRAKLIIGPLGGGSCCPEQYLKLFGKKSTVQRIRNLCVKRWKWIPFTKGTFKRADYILCANLDTHNLLDEEFYEKTSLHLETGIELGELATKEKFPVRFTDEQPACFIQIGNLEPRKGWQLTLKACAKLKEMSSKPFQVLFIGDGPELEKAKNMSKKLNLDTHLTFDGKLPLNKTMEKLASATALLFPSVRDTSGNVVLEAMTRAKPTICIEHQGAKEMTNKTSSFLVQPTSIEETANAFAKHMLYILNHPEICSDKGIAAQKRIAQYYTWDRKREYMKLLYDRILGTTS